MRKRKPQGPSWRQHEGEFMSFGSSCPGLGPAEELLSHAALVILDELGGGGGGGFEDR